MGLLNRIEELEKELLELKEQVKSEQEFPQDGDCYWYIDSDGEVLSSEWESFPSEEHMLEVGNIFKTEDESEFAVEKLKVDAELRKYSRPFKEDESNYFIQIRPSHNNVTLDSDECYQTQGTIYFESAEKARQAIEAVGGRERIKKYIFGVEEQ